MLSGNTWGSGAYHSILNYCALSNNTSFQGGGAWNCTLNHCTLSGNCACGSGSWGAGPWGGGAYGSTLNNCNLSGNSAVNQSDAAGSIAYGGGAAACTLNNCIVSGNFASGPFWPNYDSTYGGGAWNCTLNNCTLMNNSANGNYGYGGGAYECSLNNCAVMGNSAAGYAGGAYGCTLKSCTLAGNSVIGAGSYCTLINCIAYFNVGGNYDSSCSLLYCCTTPQPTNGLGNIGDAPLFANQPGGNLRLQSNSPCINAGNNTFALAGTDLDGSPRIVGGTVDIGAYEFPSPGSIISYAWLQQYGLPTDGSADYADPDGDGVDNWHEWLAGSNPTSRFSSPAQLTIIRSGPNVILTWPTNAVGFTLQSASSLTSVWSINPSLPIVIGAQNTVTNPVSGPKAFYRLSK